MVFHFLTWHFLETEKSTRKSTHERGQVLVHFSDSLVRVTTNQNTHLRSTQARGTPVLPPAFHASSHWPRNPQGQGTKPAIVHALPLDPRISCSKWPKPTLGPMQGLFSGPVIGRHCGAQAWGWPGALVVGACGRSLALCAGVSLYPEWPLQVCCCADRGRRRGLEGAPPTLHIPVQTPNNLTDLTLILDFPLESDLSG